MWASMIQTRHDNAKTKTSYRLSWRGGKCRYISKFIRTRIDSRELVRLMGLLQVYCVSVFSAQAHSQRFILYTTINEHHVTSTEIFAPQVTAFIDDLWKFCKSISNYISRFIHQQIWNCVYQVFFQKYSFQ